MAACRGRFILPVRLFRPGHCAARCGVGTTAGNRCIDHLAVFLVDYVVNLWLAPERGSWFLRNLHELLIIVLPMLRPLRVLRLITLLRVLNRVGGNALRGRILVYVISSAVVLSYVAALAVLDVERADPEANITTLGDALWWAMTTITTVGYGDHYPVTGAGRLIATALMIGGIAVLGVVTASVASWLVENVAAGTAAEVEAADEVVRKELAEVRAQLQLLTEGLQVKPASNAGD